MGPALCPPPERTHKSPKKSVASARQCEGASRAREAAPQMAVRKMRGFTAIERGMRACVGGQCRAALRQPLVAHRPAAPRGRGGVSLLPRPPHNPQPRAHTRTAWGLTAPPSQKPRLNSLAPGGGCPKEKERAVVATMGAQATASPPPPPHHPLQTPRSPHILASLPQNTQHRPPPPHHFACYAAMPYPVLRCKIVILQQIPQACLQRS